MNELRLERVSMEPLVSKGTDAKGREASGSYTMPFGNLEMTAQLVGTKFRHGYSGEDILRRQ
jgi:hypothetical protein